MPKYRIDIYASKLNSDPHEYEDIGGYVMAPNSSIAILRALERWVWSHFDKKIHGIHVGRELPEDHPERKHVGDRETII